MYLLTIIPFIATLAALVFFLIVRDLGEEKELKNN
jgi:hypothetical protein